jgi:hypothetical protein
MQSRIGAQLRRGGRDLRVGERRQGECDEQGAEVHVGLPECLPPFSA